MSPSVWNSATAFLWWDSCDYRVGMAHTMPLCLQALSWQSGMSQYKKGNNSTFPKSHTWKVRDPKFLIPKIGYYILKLCVTLSKCVVSESSCMPQRADSLDAWLKGELKGTKGRIRTDTPECAALDIDTNIGQAGLSAMIREEHSDYVASEYVTWEGCLVMPMYVWKGTISAHRASSIYHLS